MTAVAPDPGPFTNDRADQLLAMTERLIALVEAEIAALKARRLDGASGDFEEKERLSHAWRIEVSRIKAEPQLLAGLDDRRRMALREASRQLEERLSAHAQAIAAMREVTEGIVRAIASEMAASRSAPAGYGRTGQANTPGQRDASGLAVDAKA